MLKNVELLAPAGNLKKFKYAIAFGADAIYCGLPEFSLRYRINDFSYADLKAGINLAHKQNKKVYVTVNIFPHKAHLAKLANHLKQLQKLKPDALIVSDPGVLAVIKKTWPKIDIHLSTQANCTNWQSAKFWYENGVKRIILAREATLEDIKEIHKKVPKVELEVFVHGAMCMAYSGRCVLSKWLTGRSANLGDCTQSCRWKYNVYLEEKTREGNYIPIEEDQNGTYIMNSKDLCLIEYLDKLHKVGICSFKIEGRAKSLYYVANTLHAYREAIDNKDAKLKSLVTELKKAQHRDFTSGFIFGRETIEQNTERSHEKNAWEFCGEVIEWKDDLAHIHVHNSIKVGDTIEIIIPHGNIVKFKLKKIIDLANESITESHGGQAEEILIPIKTPLEPLSVLRRKISK